MRFFFGVSGRLGRGGWWLATAIYIAVALVAYALVAAADHGPPSAGTGLAIAAIVPLVAVVVSSVCVAIRRLHDRDRSGGWVLLFYVAPAILDVLGRATGAGAILFGIVSFGIGLWGLIELGFLAGTPGENEYGPTPSSAAPPPA